MKRAIEKAPRKTGVIPANAGIWFPCFSAGCKSQIPAFAGMTRPDRFFEVPESTAPRAAGLWRAKRLMALALALAGLSAHAAPLQWDVCAWGQSASGDTCTGTPAPLTWQQALQAAQQANAAVHQGQSDWRVPNRTELESLDDPTTPGDGAFWSSTSYHPAPAQAWTMDFSSGTSSPAGKTTALALRLVRGGDDHRLPGPALHAITVASSANGSVDCTPNPVIDGEDAACTATPDAHYLLAAWGDACASTPTSSLTCTLANVQAPQTVSATFTNITHAITVTPSTNGAVVCTPNPVNEGADSVCTATPASGYALASWGDACASSPASSLTCTLANVQSAQTVSATFTNITHAITVTPSANGTVVCTPNPANEGDDATCTATPETGYSLAGWGDACASTPTSSLTCTLANVQTPQTVSATFTHITHAITVTPSANGAVICTPNPVNEGDDSVCAATPASGYSLASWGDACASTPTSNLTCTLENVQSAQTVSATFTNITHAITVTPSANGSVVCTPNPVNEGDDSVCTATPASGYSLASWGDACTGTSAASLTCTLENVQAPQTVSATFTHITHAITITPSANGTVVCTPNPVNEGDDATCTATPDGGYALAGWSGACAGTSATQSLCTLVNVQASVSVGAQFARGAASMATPIPVLDRSMQALLGLLALGLGLLALRARGR